jgi:drug/metabolite transporter (DMT)-like permease
MIESFRKNKKGILLMLISALCACFGQLLWKLSVDGGIYLLIAGFLLYGVGAFIMLIAFRFGSLSVLQPMLSINYVLSIFLAATILKEQITMLKVIGVIVIMIGVVFIAGGDS